MVNVASIPRHRPHSAELRVGGLVRLSTCDWPGELVATIFCQGCPWSCGYCHNPHLIPPEGPGRIDWATVRRFIESRRGLLDGVVFSGGEPTLQAALPEAIAQVRALGFRIGLHSGGPYPARFARLLPLLDWVGFDVKAAFDDYARITGVSGSGDRARESLTMLVASGVACDVRTTVQPGLLDAADLARLDADLGGLGLGPTRRQTYRAVEPNPA
jgi:pyruvate formate lyase activating enzyme